MTLPYPANLRQERDEALARAEEAERELEQAKRGAKMSRDWWERAVRKTGDRAYTAEATLAAVREWCDKYSPSMGPRRMAELRAILDGEGEKCPTCGGIDRKGGTVATMGPDEFGNYETDDCPDGWHR